MVKFRLQLARGRVAGEIAEDARHESAALVGRSLLDKVRDVVLQQVAEQPELLRLLAFLLEERRRRGRHRLLCGVQVQRALVHRLRLRLRLIRPLLQRGLVAVGLHVAADRLPREHVRELLHDRLHELARLVRGLLPAGNHDVGALERRGVPCPEPLPDRLVDRVVGGHLAPPPFRRAARGLDGVPNLRRDARGLRGHRCGTGGLAVFLRVLAPLRARCHCVGGAALWCRCGEDAVRLRVEAFRERDRAWVGGFYLLGRQYDDFRYPVIAPERVAANCALGPDGVVAILPRLLHRLRSDRPSPIQTERILEHQVSAGDTLEWREVVRPTGQGVIPMLLLPRGELIPYFAVRHPDGVRLESQIDVRFRKFEHLVPVLILQCLRDFWMRPAFFFGHLDHQLTHALKRLFRALVVVTRNVRTPAMSVHRGSESVSFLQWLRQLAIHPEYVCILRLALCVWNLASKEVASRVPIPFRDFPARLCVERPERCAREHRLASLVSATDEVLHRSIGVGVRSSGYGCLVSHALRGLHVPALHGGKVFAILLGGAALGGGGAESLRDLGEGFDLARLP